LSIRFCGSCTQAIYAAFRRRRSLLLLNLEHQVRIDELPWVAALEEFRKDDIPGSELARQTLQEVSLLALSAFPHAILPNKLLQELNALAKTAGLDLPLVEELAADIFMGRFSPKYAVAAQGAAALLDNTLYATYYGIDYGEVSAEAFEPALENSSFSGNDAAPDEEFAEMCARRAGVERDGWNIGCQRDAESNSSRS
jgi:hypothetical protein